MALHISTSFVSKLVHDLFWYFIHCHILWLSLSNNYSKSFIWSMFDSMVYLILTCICWFRLFVLKFASGDSIPNLGRTDFDVFYTCHFTKQCCTDTLARMPGWFFNSRNPETGFQFFFFVLEIHVFYSCCLWQTCHSFRFHLNHSDFVS